MRFDPTMLSGKGLCCCCWPCTMNKQNKHILRHLARLESSQKSSPPILQELHISRSSPQLSCRLLYLLLKCPGSSLSSLLYTSPNQVHCREWWFANPPPFGDSL